MRVRQPVNGDVSPGGVESDDDLFSTNFFCEAAAGIHCSLFPYGKRRFQQ